MTAMTPTYEAVTNDALDLLQKAVAIARELIADVAKIENRKPKASKREQAPGRWVVFLGIMLIKVADGISELVKTGNARPIIVLSRCIFEYQQKAEFLLMHREEAFEQIGSIGARRHADLSKLPADPRVDVQLLQLYRDWQQTSGHRDEYSGNAGVTRMHLENVDAQDIRTDSRGNRYTEELQTAYDLSSLYVHGEPLLVQEVFPNLDDWEDWEFREDYTFVDLLRPLGAAASYILRFSCVTARAYNLPNPVKPLETLYGRVQQGMRQIRGPSV